MKFRSLLIIALIALLAGACGNKGVAVDSAESAAIADSIAQTQPAKATLFFVGDAMQHQGQLDAAKEVGNGNFDYAGYFSLLEPAIKAADYAVVNLETPLGGGRGGYTGFPCFSAPDAFAQALKDAGFDLFLTANNHTLDRSDKGLRRTLNVLDSLQVDHIGTYQNAAQRTQLVPFIKKINGIKIAFLNYTYGTNGLTAKDGAEVSLIDREAMAREIKQARDAGAELIVVLPHWGIEYELHERSAQRELSQFLMEQGVDMIIGGHPHVVQPMKVVDNPATGKKTLIVYSLGNFVSNMKTDDTRGGASVTAIVERDTNGNAHFVSATYDTFFVAKPEGSNKNFKIVPSSKADQIPAGQRGYWNTFNRRAEEMFSSSNEGVPRKAY